MVEWFWWDSSLISTTNWFHSLLWHCWFGHMSCNSRPRNDLYNVLSGTLSLYTTTTEVCIIYECCVLSSQTQLSPLIISFAFNEVWNSIFAVYFYTSCACRKPDSVTVVRLFVSSVYSVDFVVSFNRLFLSTVRQLSSACTTWRFAAGWSIFYICWCRLIVYVLWKWFKRTRTDVYRKSSQKMILALCLSISVTYLLIYLFTYLLTYLFLLAVSVCHSI